jgi:CheY-like chemotaxis protein
MKRVLLIDDDTLITRVYSEKLKKEGLEVDVAGDGQEALNKIGAAEYDLILLDLMIPIIPGIDVLREVKSSPKSKHIPVLVFSSSHWGSLVDNAIKLGADEVITKMNHTPKQVCEFVHRKLNPSPD